MTKFFKRLLKLLFAITLFFILAMVSIVYFVDPNQYKGIIEEKVLAQTGHVLSIKGPMTWKLSPALMLQLEDVTLENQKPFQNKLLSAENIRLDLAFASLFSGKAVINLKLKGVDIVVIRNNEGKSNWETLLNPQGLENQKSTKSAGNLEQHEILANSKSSAVTVILNSLQIENGQITYQDKDKNTHYQIKQLKLDMDNVMKAILGINNPVQLSFQWINLNNKKIGNLAIKADWSLKLQDDELSIRDLILKLKLADEKTTTLNGKVNIKNFSKNPNVLADIESKQFEIKSLLSEFGIEYNAALPSSADIKAQFAYQAPYLKADNVKIQLKDNGTINSNFKIDTTKASPQNLELQGDFIGTALQFNQIKLDEIKGVVKGTGGIVSIDPLSINIAKTQQQASIKIDLRGNLPKYVINSQGHNFEISNLLAVFGVDNKIQGKTNFKLNLSATGITAEQLRQSLTGNSAIEILEGKFSGVDLIALLKTLNTNIYNATSALTKKPSLNIGSSLQSLQDLWKQKQTAVNPNASTPFSSLKASVTINNGVAHNPDLLITQAEYNISGKGKIDFNNMAMDYKTSAQLKINPYPPKDDLANYLYSSSLPINISGSFANLSILPDVKTYASNAFTFAQKNLLQKSVQQEASKVVNNVIGKTLEKSMDKNLNKAVESTLNSLFEKVNQ